MWVSSSEFRAQVGLSEAERSFHELMEVSPGLEKDKAHFFGFLSLGRPYRP